jgi:adenosylcobinamide-GDP ribazoletransferase
VKTLSAAFKYLTIWHFFTSCRPNPRTIGRGAKYFPIVGLALGLMLALANYVLAPYLHPEILSIVLIALLLVSTGGLHLEGLNKTFAAPATSAAEENALVSGSWGVGAIVLVLLFKSAATESMDEKLTSSLLLTPVLARWGLLTFFYGGQTRFDQVSGSISEQITFSQLFVGTAVTLALVSYFLGRRGLWIALLISLFTLLTRRCFQRRRGVVTHANSGALVEVGETLSLVLMAAI